MRASYGPEQCIDIQHKVMSNEALHLAAAESYEKAGWKALLDDSGRDELICREARATWESKGMREKINDAVADVRAEVRANRLQWTPGDICRLIKPYPAHKDVDKQLQKLAADAFVDAGDPAAEGVEEVNDDRGVDQDGDTEQDEEEILECTEMEVADVIESAVAHNSIKPSADADPCLTDADAAIVEKSAETMKALSDAKAQLMAYGLVGAVATIEIDIRKER